MIEFWPRFVRVSVRVPRASTSVLVALPLVAVAIGLPINVLIVRGSFEWSGLIRVLRDISHRPGFWVLCLLVWLAGTRHAPVGHALLTTDRRLRITWIIAALATLIAIFAMPNLLAPISRWDTLAAGVVLPALALHLVSLPGSWGVRRTAAYETLAIAGLTFVACTLVAYGHTMIKAMLFVVCRPVDDLVMHMDTRLLGAEFYRNLAAFRVAHPAATRALDTVYMGLFEQQWWSFLFFFGARDYLNGRRYILATLVAYMAGAVCYYFLPSLGPIFHQPELFTDCARSAPDSTYLTIFLANQTQLALSGALPLIAPFAFIAAFPSLHVGLTLVVALSMRRSRVLTLFNGVVVVLTLVATVILGWHYFVDGVFGLALGAACWWFAVHVTNRDLRLRGENPALM